MYYNRIMWTSLNAVKLELKIDTDMSRITTMDLSLRVRPIGRASEETVLTDGQILCSYKTLNFCPRKSGYFSLLYAYSLSIFGKLKTRKFREKKIKLHRILLFLVCLCSRLWHGYPDCKPVLILKLRSPGC